MRADQSYFFSVPKPSFSKTSKLSEIFDNPFEVANSSIVSQSSGETGFECSWSCDITSLKFLVICWCFSLAHSKASFTEVGHLGCCKNVVNSFINSSSEES